MSDDTKLCLCCGQAHGRGVQWRDWPPTPDEVRENPFWWIRRGPDFIADEVLHLEAFEWQRFPITVRDGDDSFELVVRPGMLWAPCMPPEEP